MSANRDTRLDCKVCFRYDYTTCEQHHSDSPAVAHASTAHQSLGLVVETTSISTQVDVVECYGHIETPAPTQRFHVANSER